MKNQRAPRSRQSTRAENGLFGAVLALQSTEECRAFFRDLCTPAELEAMVDRWAVVAPLLQGVPYRKIHERTGVSVTTVGRVARTIAEGRGGYQIAATRLEVR